MSLVQEKENPESILPKCSSCNKERGTGEGSALRICSLSNLSILAHDSSYSPMSEASSGLGFRMVCLLRLYKASQLGSSPATCLFPFYDEVTPLVCSAYNLSACEIKVRKRIVKSNIIRRAVQVWSASSVDSVHLPQVQCIWSGCGASRVSAAHLKWNALRLKWVQCD